MQSFLVLLSLLLASSCLGFPDYECIYDKISKNSGEIPATIVRDLPEKGGAWQALTLSTEPHWEPIRFKFFTEDLDDDSRYCTKEGEMRPTFNQPNEEAACTTDAILTAEKRFVLTTELLPPALQMHSRRLKVDRRSDAIVVPVFTTGYCGAFTIPAEHRTTGVADADMVLYIAAGPTEGSTLAWGGKCFHDSKGRPIVGVANFAPRGIIATREGIRMAAHEIAHAIGFDITSFKGKNMITQLPIRGVTRRVVTSPQTLAKTKEHYNCDTALGMELENEGGEGTMNSHWERRNAMDELMSPYPGSAMYYTALTMAVFEDTGYFKAIWRRAEHTNWGYHSGCSFLTDKCMKNGVTPFPEMFCTSEKQVKKCTSDRYGIGQCQVVKSDTELPTEYQYFDDPKEGGSNDELTDYCPVVRMYNSGQCSDGKNLPGSRFGSGSRCLKGENLKFDGVTVGDLCMEVLCVKPSIRVRYINDDQWYSCPEGMKLTPKRTIFSQGKIVCPKRSEVCPPTNWMP